MKTAEEILKEISLVDGKMLKDFEFIDSICANHALKAMKAYAQQFTEKIKLLEEEIEYLKKSKDIPF